MNDQEHNAESLISIQKFYGEDITPEQQDYINFEVDRLTEVEQCKFLDSQKLNQHDL